MRLPNIVSCISYMRGHQNKKRSAINNALSRIDVCNITGRLDLSNLNLNNSDVKEILKYVTKKILRFKLLIYVTIN